MALLAWTVYSCTLPLMVTLEADRDTPWPRRRPSLAPILLVDDDFSIRRSIAEVLGDAGYEVRSAANGREALSMLAERGVRPGLIILDLWMPSMDGLEFRFLQRNLAGVADIPTLVITASRFLPIELKDLELTNVLRKPLHLDDLLTATRRLIRR